MLASAEFDEADLDPSLQLGCLAFAFVCGLPGKHCALCDPPKDCQTFHGRDRSFLLPPRGPRQV